MAWLPFDPSLPADHPNQGMGNNPVDPKRPPFIDWNRKYKTELANKELTDEEAVSTLGKFLMTNIGLAATVLTGQLLEPYQRIMIKGWMQKNFSLTVAGRSFGKSLVFSHFCYLHRLS